MNSAGNVSYFELFQYATWVEKAATVLGVVLSFLSGCGLTIDMSILGEMSTAFVERTHPPADRLTTRLPILSVFGGGRRLFNATHEENMAALLEDALAHVKCTSLIIVTCFLLVSLGVALVNWSALRQVTTIRMLFLEAVLRQDMSWFDTDSDFNVATTMSENTMKVKYGMGEKLCVVASLVGSVIFSVSMSLSIAWELTLACAAVIPFALAAAALLANIQIKSATQEMESYSQAGKHAEEVLKSVKTVVAFGGESLEVSRYSSLLKPAEHSGRRRGLFEGFSTGLNWILVYCVTTIALAYGARLIVRDMSNPDVEQRYVFGTFFSIKMNMFASTQILTMCLLQFEVFSAARGAAASLFKIIKRVPIVDNFDKKSILPCTPCRVMGELMLENIHFSYPSRPDVKILNDISLQIKPGQCVAFVGPSGCGKTTLLQLLQRLYEPTSGSVKLDGRDLKKLNLNWLRSSFGVVGQEPVLFRGTIFENIAIGCQEATLDEVQNVAQMANAHEFIKKLPKGYDTVIGERGAMLSGGQKQRIAIARALLREPAVLLLDEPTSALDARSEAQVQTALERAAVGRTTVVVSHRLSTIVNADRIICMEKGTIVEQGTHEELMAKNGYYRRLAMVKDQNKEMTKMSEKIKLSSELSQYNSEIKPAIDHKNQREPRKSLCSTVLADLADGDKYIQEVSAWQLLKLNAPEWVYITMGSIAAFIQGSCFTSVGLLIGYTSTIFILDDHAQIKHLADVYAGLLFVTACVAGTCMCLQSITFTVAGLKMTSRLRTLYFTALLRQEIGFYDKQSNTVGALCSRLSADTADVQNATGLKIGVILQGVSSVLIGLFVGLFFDWRLTLVTSAVLPLIVGSTWLEGRLSQTSQINERAAMEAATSLATEAVIAIRTIKSLCIETVFLDKFQKMLSEACSAVRRPLCCRGITIAMGLYTPLLCCCVCFYYGATLVANGSMEYKVILLVAESLVFGSFMLGQTLIYTSSFNKVGISAGRILSVINREPLVKTYTDIQYNKDWSASGNVSFNKVKFSYPTRKKQEVLRGVDLNVETGTTAALVGSSGCGKSTILQLMQRFYDPDTGTIKLDEIDIKASLTLPRLRQQLGVVQQEPVLFDRSLAENIAYGDNSKHIEMDEIIAACKTANIHTFIMSLPKGYETRLGAGGAQLSGGQKQRVCIARALVRAPRLLLLDEATSALDANSERVVSAALVKAAKGRTCVTIAHRLSTVQNADVIFVIHEGKIVEKGNHMDLMKTQGLYYRMYKEQNNTTS